MQPNRRRLRLVVVGLLAFPLMAAGCSQRNVGPVVGSEPARLTRGDILEADDVAFPASTMERFLANRLAGVVVRQAGNSQSIQIRGSSSFSSSNEALIMVDGREFTTQDFLLVNPADVKRIQVLRGGNAAIYGRRGANGVLVVTMR
jgi:TonB-dependent SusC/RagA subfamily outer membrane receptor